MSLSDSFEDLDPQIAGPLRRITDALREEIRSQIDEVRKEVGRLSPPGAARAAAAPPSAGDGSDSVAELKHAAAAIDGSASQAAVLTALLEGAGRFSSRAAFFLIRDDGMHCWGSLGFEEAERAMQGERVDVAAGSAWSRITDGSGAHALTAEECAGFCDQFGAAAPEMGMLLPMSLGDQVAACLYTDRMGGGSLEVAGLQLLTLIAGQPLETLPMRQRSATPVLSIAATEAGAAPAVEPAAAAVPEISEPEPEVAFVEPEPKPEPEPEAAEPEAAHVEPEPEAVEPELAPQEEPLEELPVADAPATPGFEVAPAEAEVPLVEAPEEVSAVAPQIEEQAIEEPPAAPAVEAAAVEEPAMDAAPAGVAEDRSSTQVVPPDDVLGPGWAFTTKEVATDAGNDALQEEARRLARLLVTEIKLYNEEQVEQGRRSGDIYRRLREDIDRSRQIFDDRIDDQIRAESDYFKDALVRILAGGDESLLGM